MISISVDRAAGQSIVVLRVNRPSDNAYYTHKGAVWVRVGSTNRKLEGQTLLDYLRGRQILSFDESTDTTATVADLDDLSFDESTDTTATVADLDELKVRRYLERRGNGDFLENRTISEFLINSQLATHDSRIKNSTVLLFGGVPRPVFSAVRNSTGPV